MQDPKITELRTCEQRVAVSVLVASRESGIPLSTEEVVAVLKIDRASLLRALWKWKKVGGSFKELSDVEWIPQINQRLGLPATCERRAREISSMLKQVGHLDPKRRALVSCYISGLEHGMSPRVNALQRTDRLWLLKFAGFGRRSNRSEARRRALS
ncbi:hypothetical protein PQ610_03605 [Tardisphaera miroshnichenkoae]